jgi:sugar lactone lactonase YvrE
MAGLAFGESPRWHDDRLWFSDWGAQAVVAADLEGNRETVLAAPRKRARETKRLNRGAMR